MLTGNEFGDLDVKSKIPVLELRRLVIGIHDNQRNTGFRFRLMGELWHPSFLTVITVSDESVLLLNETNNRMISVNFTLIMQFEIDLQYQEYSPNFHYTVNHLV
jgi:hypothetical protein